MPKIETAVFYGRAKSQLEDSFLRWRQTYSGSVHVIKRHDIKMLQTNGQTNGHKHGQIAAQEAFTMLVEYKEKSDS